MKVCTNTLIGPALDWAVAHFLDKEAKQINAHGPVHLWRSVGYDPLPFQPTKDWAVAGPLIDKHGISLRKVRGVWRAMSEDDSGTDEGVRWHQFTWRNPVMVSTDPSDRRKRQQRFDHKSPLVAAMQCLVASRFPETIDIPQELADELGE